MNTEYFWIFLLAGSSLMIAAYCCKQMSKVIDKLSDIDVDIKNEIEIEDDEDKD